MVLCKRLLAGTLTTMTLCLVTAACRHGGGASTASSDVVDTTHGSSALAGTTWTYCPPVLGSGAKTLYLRYIVRFTDSAQMAFEGETFASDAACRNALAESAAISAFATKISPRRKFQLGYKLGTETAKPGVYPINIIYGPGNGDTTAYTTAAMSKDRLRISDTCNIEQIYTGVCETVTGRSADTRADRLDQEAYLFDLRR